MCYQTLTKYIQLTSGKHGPANLVCSYQKPFKPVSTDTLRRWIRQIMKKSGVSPAFGVHSVRGASASAAISKGASIDEVMNSVGWKNEKTVARHYNKTVERFNYQLKILS